jgi:hypothetical protein
VSPVKYEMGFYIPEDAILQALSYWCAGHVPVSLCLNVQ